MTFAVDTTANVASFDAIANMDTVGQTWNHTIAAGANKILVTIALGSSGVVAARAVNSVTVGGVAASKIANQDDGNFCNTEIWRLNNPPTGVQAILVKAGGGSTIRGRCGSISFIDANAVEGTPAGATGTTNNPSVSVPSAVGDICVDAYNSDEQNSLTGQSGTSIFQSLGIGSDIDVSSQYQAATTTSTAMSYTANEAANLWALVGIAVKAAAAAGGQPSYPRRPRQFNRRALARFM